MITDPVQQYGAKVLADGYRLTGDVRSGLKATVPYLLDWDAAFNFAGAVISPMEQSSVGGVTITAPYRFPGVATPMYAQRFSIEPRGFGGTPAPNHGLLPGEFFAEAVVAVEFESVPWNLQPFDDPYGLNQLDPANPITFCEQSVKIGGRMVTRPGSNYVYADTSTPVVGSVGVLQPEAKLLLRFPRVPYLPWQLLVPYVGKVNRDPIFGCAAETLLLESPETQAKAALGSTTSIEQEVSLEFAYNPGGWNDLPHADGTMATVFLKGDLSKSIYELADFSEIFAVLRFSG